MRNPYNALRLPSSKAPMVALMAVPIDAIFPTPMMANWDAPLKSSSESRQVWSTESPLETEAAPKAIAYSPTAKAKLKPSRVMRFFTWPVKGELTCVSVLMHLNECEIAPSVLLPSKQGDAD